MSEVRLKDITSVFRGVSTPLPELIEQIEAQGWTLEKIKQTKNGYSAKAKNVHGNSLERTHADHNTAVANLLMAVVRRNYMNRKARLSAWDMAPFDDVQAMAKAYAEAPIYDPKAVGAWKELADDSVSRAAILGEQVEIEVVDDPEPYSSAQEMCEDLHQNQKFKVSRANSDHPVWTVEQNVAFRTVHDILGHCVQNGSFDWEGEKRACSAHLPLLSPNAQRALITECLGQTAYAAYYRGFGPQKIAFMDDFADPAQQENNPASYQGVHPSQSLAPVAPPSIPDPDHDQYGLEKGNVAPHQEGLGLTPVFTKKSNQAVDPNWNWNSGIEPTPGQSQVDYGDPLGYSEVHDLATEMDTGWSRMDENDPAQRAMMRQAVVNALRVALLSPRKDLKANAVHYQDISHIPAEVDDPKVYWDALEHARRQHNVARGRDPEAHLVYYKPRRRYYQLVQMMNPDLSPQDAIDKADKVIFQMQLHETERLEQEDSEKSPDKQRSADEIERKVNQAIAKRLKQITDQAFNEQTDVGNSEQQTLFAKKIERVETNDPRFQGVQVFKDNDGYFVGTRGRSKSYESLEDIPDSRIEKIRTMGKMAGKKNEQYDIFTGESSDLYSAWMGTHLKAVADVSRHADELLEAAIKDVQEYDGSGHYFRSQALQMDIKGVGPKVISFAWLLLQPTTSQLATIDTHMMDTLGHQYEKEMNNRDFFKFERELQAGRDASGYGHVPLGQFQWAFWDYKRAGPGIHQDHSALKVLNPTPHDNVDWEQVQRGDQNLKGEDWYNQAPEWWQATQPAREQVAQHWDSTIGQIHPATSYPFENLPHFSKKSSDTRMRKLREQQGLSTEEIWELNPDEDSLINS